MKKALLCTALLVVPLFHISAQDYRVRRIGPDNGKTTFAYGFNSHPSRLLLKFMAALYKPAFWFLDGEISLLTTVTRCQRSFDADSV